MEKEKSPKRPVHTDAVNSSYLEKRGGSERRVNNKKRLKYLFINGRRERARRKEDWEKAFFFDRYNQKLFAAITAILMLSVFDALLTLVLIENGSSELNPVMDYFLAYGPLTFFIAKYVLTSVGVIILLIFKNVFLSRVKIYTYTLFPCIILVFSMIIAWELFLVFMVL